MTAANPYYLEKGSHKVSDGKRCAMEWVAFIAGEPHSDHPVCVSPFLQSFGIAFNDRLGDEDRQKLRPYLARCIGTAGDGLDDERHRICREWLIRETLPEWLDLAGRTTAAQRLRDLPDPLVEENVLRLVREARDEARSARTEALAKLRKQLTARFGPAAAAVATADAAVATADAAAATVVSVTATADAAAAYVAVAAAAYVAVAAAAAAYDAADPSAFKKYVYDAVKAKATERLKPIKEQHTRAGFELLDKMLPTVPLVVPARVEEAKELAEVRS